MKKLMKSVLACALAFAMVLTVMPVNTYAANKKAVVVTNQKQLEKALKNGATNIVIKTNKNVKITIPASKKAAKASISVQAKNATITNKASVKSIEIKDAKAFVESGKNNDIKITDSKLSLTVSKASKGADIQVAKKDADIKVVAKGDVASVTVAKTANVALTVNKTAKVDSVNVAAKGASVDLNAKGTVSDVKVSEKAADTKLNINASGKVENVQIDAKADVAVAGSTTEAVKVTVNAKDTTIKAETPIDTTLNADTKLDLSKGAEGSTVTTGENVKADVANNTTDKVTVKDSTGKETTVDAGTTETKTDDGKKDDNSNSVATDTNPGNISWGGSENEIGLDGVSGDGPDKTVEVGSEITLIPIFTPANATNKIVRWSITDSSVASVYNGVVYGKKPGTTTVTVTTDQMGYKYSWNITVTEATLTGIKITDWYDELYIGESGHYIAEAVPSAAKLDGLTWKSSNTDVATIDNSGKVTAISEGETDITVSCKGVTSVAKTLKVVAKPDDAVKVTFYNDSLEFAVTYIESGKTLEDAAFDIPSKTGYEFVGWSKSATTQEIVTEDTVINEDTNLYAVYEKKKYCISFAGAEGSYEYEAKIIAPTCVEREGYTSLGWASVRNASKPEFKIGDEITVTGDASYYPVYAVKMILITQSGEHVKYYTGALKDENGNNLTYDEDGTLSSKNNTGYLPYDNKSTIGLYFRSEAGYVITKITLDNSVHDITTETGKNYIQQAVEQGYVVVDRKENHTIVIETKALNIDIQTASDKVTKSTCEIEGEGSYDEYIIVGEGPFALKDFIKVSEENAANISYKYWSGQASYQDAKNITPEELVFSLENGEGSAAWCVKISLTVNNQSISKIIWVDVKKTDSNGSDSNTETQVEAD